MVNAAPRVVVVGAVNVDRVVAATRLPGPGETVVGRRGERHPGGKGANAAVAAARAGARVTLIAAVGDDTDGAGALADLRADGVDVGAVTVLVGEPTGIALIVVDPTGENQIAVGAGANASVTAGQVRQALAAVLPDTGCVLVSTEVPGDAVLAAVERATAAGVPCVLNPAPPLPEVVTALDHGPLLTPNATESVLLAGLLGGPPVTGLPVGPAADPGAAARALGARTGAPVVVTLGGEGALVLRADGGGEHVPPRPTVVRDTTGAGDTFNGVLATWLAAGEPLARAVRAATAAASLSVAQAGARTGMPARAAIEAALAAEIDTALAAEIDTALAAGDQP